MNGLLAKLRILFRRRQLDADLEDELASHLALKQRALGDGPGGHLAMGNTTRWKERTREEWGFGALEDYCRDAVFGLRLMAKDKRFTLVVLITLALGIGANAAMFSAIDGLLLKALPVARPEQLVRIVITHLPPDEKAWSDGKAVQTVERRQMPYPLFEKLRIRGIFKATFGQIGMGMVVAEIEGAPQRALSANVTGDYFTSLGVDAQAGRVFTAEEDIAGGPSGGWPLVISDGLWTRAFARRTAALGSKVTVERISFTIVGVAPASFTGVHPGVETELWIPASAMEHMYPDLRWRTNRSASMLQAMARLEPGASLETANRRLAAISRSLLEEAQPPGLEAAAKEAYLSMKLELRSMAAGDSWVGTTYGKTLWILLAAVGAVFLIAALNLANLFLARSLARRREIAVRLALGASALRVQRQLLVETAMLALAGVAGGLLLAQWLTVALQQALSSKISNVRIDTSLDATVLTYLAGLMALVVFALGGAPCWHVSKLRLNHVMKQRASGANAFRWRAALVIAQISISFVLLAAGAVTLRSLEAIYRERTGFDPAHTLLLVPDLFNAGIGRESQGRAYQHLLNEARAMPEVQAAAWTSIAPLTGGLSSTSVEVAGAPPMKPMDRVLFRHTVSDGYFAALGLAVVEGRDFSPGRAGRSDVCLLSENAAAKFFGNRSAAIGRRLRPNGGKPLEVIGIVADAKYQHVREPAPPTLYMSYWNSEPHPGMTMILRSRSSGSALLKTMTALFTKEAGRQPFVEARTLDESRDDSLRMERLLATLLAGFAGVALLISLTGIAGLLSYLVEQRKKEIGIRIALGAPLAVIRGQVQRQGVLLTAAGISIGFGTFFALRKLIATQLYGVAAMEPGVLAGVAVLLSVAALGATTVPAWRAARIDPIETLRGE